MNSRCPLRRLVALCAVELCLKPVMHPSHHQCTLSVGQCYQSLPQPWDAVRPWDHQFTLSVGLRSRSLSQARDVWHHQCTLSVGLCSRSVPRPCDAFRPWHHQCRLSGAMLSISISSLMDLWPSRFHTIDTAPSISPSSLVHVWVCSLSHQLHYPSHSQVL